MSVHARIAALLRELADAYEELADEQPRKPRRETRNAAVVATEAARKVREGLRKKGTVNASS